LIHNAITKNNVYIYIFSYMFEWICRLALPASILSWKGVAYNEEVIDNPLDHDGRIRSFKHERGNWATLIYINCKYFDIKRYK